MERSKADLLNDLEEARKSLAEVVEEVVYFEDQVAKYKSSNERLSKRVHELEK